MSMQMVTQSLLVYRITGSAAILGIIALATGVPQVIFSLFSGALADRFPKKHLIQLAQSLSAATSLLIAICLATGYISVEKPDSWWVLLVTSFIQGAMNALMMTARSSIIPELVPRDQIVNAMSLNSMGMQVFQFLAPAAAGILIDVSGFAAVYFIMSGLCMMAIILTNFLPVTASRKPGDNKRSIMKDIIQGLQYAKNDTTVLLIVIFTMMCVVIAQPLSTLLSVFADDILKVGATGMGILQGVLSAGALAASLFFASIPPKSRGLLMLIGGLCLGLSQAAFAFSTSWPLSLLLIVFIGVGRIGHMTPATTLLQSYTDPLYLGRVISLLNLSMGLGSLTTFLNGVIAEFIGVQWTVGLFAIILILADVIIFFTVPRIRKID